MDYTTQINNLQHRIYWIIDGKLDGWTSGFSKLDDSVGRILPGQLWAIGGYNGTGKSYFILNMIEGMLTEWEKLKNDKDYQPPKVAVFSTELSTEDYILRHVLMRMQIYMSHVQNYRMTVGQEVIDELTRYNEERILNPDSLKIYGNISSFSQIEKEVKRIKDTVNIIFVDYVQELSVNDKYDEKETMPILARKFKTLAMENNLAIVLVSQLNIYAMGKDYHVTSAQVPAFSNGKQLNSTASVSLILNRVKEEGILQKELNVHIMKARSGVLGVLPFEILDGYNLKYINKNQNG